MDYNIVSFDKTMLHMLPRPQQPFDIIGKLVPTYDGTEWKTTEHLLEAKKEKICRWYDITRCCILTA